MAESDSGCGVSSVGVLEGATHAKQFPSFFDIGLGIVACSIRFPAWFTLESVLSRESTSFTRKSEERTTAVNSTKL